MIDSHCHLADSVFASDLEPVVARAREAGVRAALVILAAGDEEEAAQAKQVQALWPDVRLAIGVHPHNARQFTDHPERAAEVVAQQILWTATARAVGEIGLDFHYDFSPPDVQKAVFRAQLKLARTLDRPVVIHTREADEDTLAILRELGGPIRGVLHCFSGTETLARAGLALGLHVSFAGIVTFPRAHDVRAVARAVPLDRLLAETDSPFLAPVPHRGRRNEPAHVTEVVAQLAKLHGLAPDDLARRTEENFQALFRP